MYQPEAYAASLAFMIISMICWGSWANTMKLTAGYAFQLFYSDYVIGIVVGSLLWGLTLGSLGGGDLSFLNNIRQTDSQHILFASRAGPSSTLPTCSWSPPSTSQDWRWRFRSGSGWRSPWASF
jgi:glucose uptake protein